jgi:hypothetical protein
MKIVGIANSMPGESLSQTKTDPIEMPPAPNKVQPIAAGNAAGSLANEIKMGLARVFEKINLPKTPPPPPGQLPPDPYDKDRRKKAVAKYKKVLQANKEDPNGKKFNKAA